MFLFRQKNLKNSSMTRRPLKALLWKNALKSSLVDKNFKTCPAGKKIIFPTLDFFKSSFQITFWDNSKPLKCSSSDRRTLKTSMDRRHWKAYLWKNTFKSSLVKKTSFSSLDRFLYTKVRSFKNLFYWQKNSSSKDKDLQKLFYIHKTVTGSILNKTY